MTEVELLMTDEELEVLNSPELHDQEEFFRTKEPELYEKLRKESLTEQVGFSSKLEKNPRYQERMEELAKLRYEELQRIMKERGEGFVIIQVCKQKRKKKKKKAQVN